VDCSDFGEAALPAACVDRVDRVDEMDCPQRPERPLCPRPLPAADPAVAGPPLQQKKTDQSDPTDRSDESSRM